MTKPILTPTITISKLIVVEKARNDNKNLTICPRLRRLESVGNGFEVFDVDKKIK